MSRFFIFWWLLTYWALRMNNEWRCVLMFWNSCFLTSLLNCKFIDGYCCHCSLRTSFDATSTADYCTMIWLSYYSRSRWEWIVRWIPGGYATVESFPTIEAVTPSRRVIRLNCHNHVLDSSQCIYHRRTQLSARSIVYSVSKQNSVILVRKRIS